MQLSLSRSDCSLARHEHVSSAENLEEIADPLPVDQPSDVLEANIVMYLAILSTHSLEKRDAACAQFC